jgi:cystathionine beta-lyase
MQQIPGGPFISSIHRLLDTAAGIFISIGVNHFIHNPDKKTVQHDFDEIVDRTGTDSLKYDFAAERGMPDGLIPMWVADMDFRCPDPVRDAVRNLGEFGIFGYTEAKSDYYEAVAHWFEERHGFTVDRRWIVKTPGVVFALATAVRAYTEPGDGVLIQKPVYYPFSEVILDNDRKIVNNPLVYKDGRFTIDFEDFENKITGNKVKLFLLCSPHNPVGRVWTREELKQMGDICLKHGCVVASDEIHCDFVFPGNRHRIFASVSDDFVNNCLIFTAPSKTFNIAGLQISNNFIPNPELRKKFRRQIDATGYSQLNTVGLEACKAAYQKGAPWLDELKKYLEGNLDLMRTFLMERIPQIQFVEPEGTYLVLLDFRKWSEDPREINDLLIKSAGVWLDDGRMFGEEGAGFQRINIACPRALLQEALEKLEKAIQGTTTD